MSKNTQISELINYISVDGSGNVVLSSGQLVATQSYVSTAITNLVNSAPSTLDTLNELATALGNDPNFATTVATSIGTKQAQLNGTGFVKVTGTTVSYDNSTYLTTSSASSTYLPLTGGTLTGPLTGTTASFSSFITVQSTGGSGLRIYGSSGTNQWDMYLNSTNLRFSDNTGTGRVVFDNTIQTPLAYITSSAATVLINRTGGTTFGAGVQYQTSGTNNWIVGTGQTTVGTDYQIYNYGLGAGAIAINYANNNVGIGIQNSGSKLSVSGSNSGSNPLVDLTASGTGTFQRGVRLLNSGMNAGDHIMYAVGQADSARNMGQFYFQYNGAGSTSNRVSMGMHSVDDVFNILGSGNVGVGTINPLEKFSVNGSIHIAGVGNSLLFDTDASGRSISQYVTNLYEFHIVNGRGNSARFVLGNGSISLGTSATPQFYINTSTGNIGVGTTDFANLAFGSSMIKIAGSRATLGLQSSGTLSTIALIAANNTATAMHMNFESTGAFRWYSYVSAGETFSLLGNGRLGLGVSSPDARLHVGGPILVSNNSQTFRRAITCYGQTGTYTQIKVYFNKNAWGSVTYDIKLASAGGSHHTAGGYYSNPGIGSHVNSINTGTGLTMTFAAGSQSGDTQGAAWTFSGATMIHPILTIDIACGNGYQVNPDDIVVQFT